MDSMAGRGSGRPGGGDPSEGRDGGLEAEDQAGAEAELAGCRDVQVAAAAHVGAADRGQGAVADLTHTPVDVRFQGVIDAAVEDVIQLADVYGASWGLGGAQAEGELGVGSKWALEGLAGDAR